MVFIHKILLCNQATGGTGGWGGRGAGGVVYRTLICREGLIEKAWVQNFVLRHCG